MIISIPKNFIILDNLYHCDLNDGKKLLVVLVCKSFVEKSYTK